MKGSLKRLAFLLLFGMIQTETWRVVRFLNYDFSVSMVQLFWFTDEAIMAHWYFKFLSEDLFIMILFYVIAQLSKMVSIRFYQFAMLATVYKFIDLLMFFANFKRWENGYTIMLGVCLICTAFILYPKREKSSAIIKSIS